MVQEVYGRIDAMAGRELGRLRLEEGIVSSCRRGCCSCCGQHIQTNLAEAHTLGRYIKRTFSVQQISDLKRRTQRWLAWDGVRRQGDPSAEHAVGPELFGDEPCCPLLVDRACSAYPVRPVICRTHYVSSDPSDCRASHDHRPVEHPPVVLTSILLATQPLSLLFRAEIEAAGLDFSRSIMLLPHWLAIEMGWELASES
jgi:Fe-S-cluster containining protein